VTPLQADFWNVPLAELEALAGSAPNGLSAAQADERLQQFGRNTLQERSEQPVWLQFLARFRSPLVLLLLAASVVSAISGDLTGCLIIGFIVIFSVSLDYVQEHQAGKAVDALRQSVAVHARVLRDGVVADRPVTSLVPGDVCLVSAGDIIPADCRVQSATDCFVNQAALTGESYPVEKSAGDLAKRAADMSDAGNAVFTGGSVVSGFARLVVCRTGASTAFGQIAASLAAQRPPTSFDIGTQHFGMLIMRMTATLVLAVLAINWYLHRPLLESLLFSIALAVGLTPELLPMITTITLSRGAVRMARKQVIIKQLQAINNLGSMDVLCTDKTGTLTESRIELIKHIDAEGTDSERVLQLAYLNSFFETGLKSPLDEAILAHTGASAAGWSKIDEVPFDFERRRVSVLIDNGTQRLLVSKGAPEDVLKVSTLCLAAQTANPGAEPLALDERLRAAIQAVHDAQATQGFRLLGVAYRECASAQAHARLDDESQLIFAGFVAFVDPPKQDARAALAALNGSGITVKVITGDNELVTRHVCQEVGMPVSGILTGHDIAAMDDLALGARAETVNVFCRVTPPQKNRIIRALKQRGHTVGYLGDGINDAPSLHAADIGISVDSAVDVAKAAAQVVMLRHDLGVLHDGVMEGRRTFGNVMKYILMGTSSNFGNMFSMAGAAALLPFLPMRPMQILLNNLLYDVSELAIPFDTVDEQDRRMPRHWDMGFIRRFMIIIGSVSSLFDFLTFYLMLAVFHANAATFQTGWFVESMATQVLVIFVVRTRGNPFRSRCSPWLVLSTLGVATLAVTLPYTPIAAALGFVPLPLPFLAAIAATVVVYLLLVAMVKRVFYARWANTSGPAILVHASP
jgi:Mg2+-importing ATPase